MAATSSSIRVAIAGLIGLVVFAFFFAALFPGAVSTILAVNTTGWTATMILLLDFIIIVLFLAVVILILGLIGLEIF